MSTVGLGDDVDVGLKKRKLADVKREFRSSVPATVVRLDTPKPRLRPVVDGESFRR